MAMSRTNMQKQIKSAPASKKKTFVTPSGIKVTKIKKDK